jgi:hypothetical protein
MKLARNSHIRRDQCPQTLTLKSADLLFIGRAHRRLQLR